MPVAFASARVELTGDTPPGVRNLPCSRSGIHPIALCSQRSLQSAWMKRPAKKSEAASAPPSSSFIEVFERVVCKGIRIELESADESAGAEVWGVLSVAGLLKIEGTLSWHPLLDRAPTPSPSRRRSRSPRPKSG